MKKYSAIIKKALDTLIPKLSLGLSWASIVLKDLARLPDFETFLSSTKNPIEPDHKIETDELVRAIPSSGKSVSKNTIPPREWALDDGCETLH